MAATVNTFIGMSQSGRPVTISAYNAASAAVVTYLPLSKSGTVAGANSPQFQKINENIVLTDLPCSAATGTIAIEVDGVDQFFLDYSAHQVSNNGRPKYGLKVGAGSILAFRVIAALAA